MFYDDSTCNNGLQGMAFSGLSSLRLICSFNCCSRCERNTSKKNQQTLPSPSIYHDAEMGRYDLNQTNVLSVKSPKGNDVRQWHVRNAGLVGQSEEIPDTSWLFSWSCEGWEQGNATPTSEQSFPDNGTWWHQVYLWKCWKRLLGCKNWGEKKSSGRRGCRGEHACLEDAGFSSTWDRKPMKEHQQSCITADFHENSLPLGRNGMEAKVKTGLTLWGPLHQWSSIRKWTWGHRMNGSSGSSLRTLPSWTAEAAVQSPQMGQEGQGDKAKWKWWPELRKNMCWACLEWGQGKADNAVLLSHNLIQSTLN